MLSQPQSFVRAPWLLARQWGTAMGERWGQGQGKGERVKVATTETKHELAKVGTPVTPGRM